MLPVHDPQLRAQTHNIAASMAKGLFAEDASASGRGTWAARTARPRQSLPPQACLRGE